MVTVEADIDRVERRLGAGRAAIASKCILAGAPAGVRWVSNTCRRLTVRLRILARPSRCSTDARMAVTAASIVAVFNEVAVIAAIPTETASASSVLRQCPVDSTRTRAASMAGTSVISMPSAKRRSAR